MHFTIPFTKLEAAQNDFIVIDNRNRSFTHELMAAIAPLLSHRRKGIGSDGVILIETHPTLDFTMHFFNPDGSVGSMCGNGGRCAALFARTNSIAAESMEFVVLDRTYRAEIFGESVRLHFPPPRLLELDRTVSVGGHKFTVHIIDTGAPHVVLFVADDDSLRDRRFDAIDVAVIGAAIRSDVQFAPIGTNVNFVAIDDDGIRIRTFEKGVEAETMSCGTGTIASALIANAVHGLASPVHAKSFGGDDLVVSFTKTADGYTGISLEGPARFVFRGVVTVDSETGAIVNMRSEKL